MPLYSDDPLTKQFYFRVAGSVDPRAARPLLGPGEQAGLDFFTFTQPPVIEAEVRGRATTQNSSASRAVWP